MTHLFYQRLGLYAKWPLLKYPLLEKSDGICGLPDAYSVGTIDDQSTSVSYGGRADNWIPFTNQTTASATTLSRSNNTGSRSNIKFSGSKISLLYSMGPDRGSASVYIDNAHVTTFSAYAPQYRRQVGRTWPVSNGIHTFEVRSAGGGYVDVDAFATNITTVGSGTYDNTNSQFRFITTGNWTHQTGVTGVANGTQSLANSPGALFRFTFDGNAVTYYFTKAYNRGKAVVTIDGVDKGVVDMYSPTVDRQQSQTYSGLGTGTHIINVLVTGTQNSQSIGAFVDVDQLVVQ